jgi:hypothetical protein
MTHISWHMANGSATAPVDAELLARIGFTDHAIERFAQRAAVGTRSRHVIEPIIRDLLLVEGRVVPERPTWARSRRQADMLLQLREWMLLIGCEDRVYRGRYSIVTALNGPADNSWRNAWRRGYISTPPPTLPRRHRPSVVVSAVRGIDDRRTGEWLLTGIRRVHATRRQAAQSAYDRALLEWWRSGGVR